MGFDEAKCDSVESNEEITDILSGKETEDTEKSSVVINENGKRYVCCETCKKKVPTGSWKRHVRSHLGERHYSCAACGLAFTDGGNLARHARALHARQRPHRCPACRKAFTRKSHLQDHIKSHDDARDYVCDICGKASKSTAALRMHKKTHENFYRFECMECGAKFKRNTELRAHVTVHTGEKAHGCLCGKTFRLRSQLTAHSRIHKRHDDTFEKFEDVKLPLPGPASDCAFCTGDPLRDRYADYMRRINNGNLLCCQKCGKTFRVSALLNHMTEHAKDVLTPHVEKTNAIPNKEKQPNLTSKPKLIIKTLDFSSLQEQAQEVNNLHPTPNQKQPVKLIASTHLHPDSSMEGQTYNCTIQSQEGPADKFSNLNEKGQISKLINATEGLSKGCTTIPKESEAENLTTNKEEKPNKSTSPREGESNKLSSNQETEANKLSLGQEERPNSLTVPSQGQLDRLSAQSQLQSSRLAASNQTSQDQLKRLIAPQQDQPNRLGVSVQGRPTNALNKQGLPNGNQKIIVVIQKYKNLCPRHIELFFQSNNLQKQVFIQNIAITKCTSEAPVRPVNNETTINTSTTTSEINRDTKDPNLAEDRVAEMEAPENHKKVTAKINSEKRTKEEDATVEPKIENVTEKAETTHDSDSEHSLPKRPRRIKKTKIKTPKRHDESLGSAEERGTKEERPSEKSPKASRTCPICGKTYRASSSYFYHMKYFHKRSREHECTACGKKFGTKASLAQHASVHSGAYELECKECGKRFRSKPSLYIHEQSHGGVKRWACAQCGRSFRWRTHLARHAQRHAAARAHVCATCGRGFSVRCDLLRHARTHAAAEFHCDACPLKFAQKRYLKVHVLKKHAPTAEPRVESAAAPAAALPQVVTRS